MEFITVGDATEVPAGELVAFDVLGDRVAVANANGTYYAISDVCTHMQCPLSEGTLEETTVTCRCHGSQFDVTTGAVQAGPATEPVRAFRTKVEGESLQIEA